MAVEVLKTHKQNNIARSKMKLRGIDCASSLIERVLQKIDLYNGVHIGDIRKSWDVLKSIEFIEKNLTTDSPILDIGSYGSELPCSLCKMEYSKLTGIDLNPDISKMPFAGKINYLTSDFLHTPFHDESFLAITAISVIEHGYQSQKLLREISRLLKPGGFFIASVDYWPEKINTCEIKAFGMDWQIFSRDEIEDFFREATEYGLEAFGTKDYSAKDTIIHWQGKKFTFAWFVLQKR